MTRPGEHGLYAVEVRLTRACNQNCIHCSVSGGRPAGNELATPEIFSILAEMAEMGVPYITFTGGEPLLHPDLLKIVEKAASLGLIPNLDTNGTLLTEEVALKLKEAGLDRVQVSLDGTEGTHDRIRGEGSFKEAVRGIKNAVGAGLKTSVNFTVSGLNLRELEAVADLAQGLGADTLSLERFISTGRGQTSGIPPLEPREFREVLIELYGLQARFKIKLTTTDPLRVLVLEDLQKEYADEMERRICGGCTAGIAALTVSFDGEVYPCPKVPHPLGNIREESLFKLWVENMALEPFRMRTFEGKCKTCPLLNICGGCRAEALARGEIFGEDPLCWK